MGACVMKGDEKMGDLITTCGIALLGLLLIETVVLVGILIWVLINMTRKE